MRCLSRSRRRFQRCPDFESPNRHDRTAGCAPCGLPTDPHSSTRRYSGGEPCRRSKGWTMSSDWVGLDRDRCAAKFPCSTVQFNTASRRPGPCTVGVMPEPCGGRRTYRARASAATVNRVTAPTDPAGYGAAPTRQGPKITQAGVANEPASSTYV